jgi:uncharacterized protein (TIGR00255 family)
MAVYSMTGFASTLSEGDDKLAIAVELRSVNSRFLDLAFKLPDEWRAAEPALREALSAAFKRGKIELRVSQQAQASSDTALPSPDTMNALARAEATVQSWLPGARGLSVAEVMNLARSTRASDADPQTLLPLLKRCIAGLRDA